MRATSLEYHRPKTFDCFIPFQMKQDFKFPNKILQEQVEQVRNIYYLFIYQLKNNNGIRALPLTILKKYKMKTLVHKCSTCEHYFSLFTCTDSPGAKKLAFFSLAVVPEKLRTLIRLIKIFYNVACKL